MNEHGAFPAHLVIEGPIGVGKTTLARRLAERFEAELILETADENPFLERFYRDGDGRGAALPTQLAFLVQRSRQLASLRQPDLFRRRIVVDYMSEKDRLFAEVNLDAEELQLYDQLARRLMRDLPAPDLVVYLQAPVEVLLRRIRGRDRPAERTIDTGYLKRLGDAYTAFFYHYERSPLLIVNAETLNPIARDPDFELLVERIETTRSGRHYFNPGPLLL